MSSSIKVGIIGGSGFYCMDELEKTSEVTVETEFGSPSSPLLVGKIGGVDVVVLCRHGKKHHVNPTEVNYRANIRALQKLGVTHILAMTACGSLKEEKRPGDVCILDSFIDRTTKRVQTFHDGKTPGFGNVSHVPMSPAFCDVTRRILIETAKRELPSSVSVHDKATVVTIEGPRFSSKAESLLFKSWGCDVVNMTAVPEVVLAAEAGMSYASVAMVTDYDCWREGAESVNVEAVIAVLKANVDNVKRLFVKAVQSMENNADWKDVIDNNKVQT